LCIAVVSRIAQHTKARSALVTVFLVIGLHIAASGGFAGAGKRERERYAW
jgi:hypothetical protein